MHSDSPDRNRNRLDRRYSWREKSHQESHSLDVGHLEPIMAHPLVSQEPTVIVQTTQGVADMVAHLQAAGAFAFDSEFIGERSYVPLLCLMQVATSTKVFVIDPMAGADLAAFYALFADGAIEKIVLAGQQDFGPAVDATNRPPANIMDAQIAAGFIHTEFPLSLGKLLQEFVGVSLGKTMGFTHWDNRPLSPVQVRYAADDVRYLPAAQDAINQRLTQLGRLDWARQECAAVLEDISLYRPAPESIYLRVRPRNRLSRRELGILRELAIVRDLAAREQNVPARTLLKDGILIALSRHPAANLAALDDIQGLPRPVEARYGRQIVEATARAMALPEDQLPPPEPAESRSLQDKVDKIWEALGAYCAERSIATALVASRKEIARLCQAAAAGLPLDELRLLRGWRKEFLGDLLTNIL